jgi:hypothetical protein
MNISTRASLTEMSNSTRTSLREMSDSTRTSLTEMNDTTSTSLLMNPWSLAWIISPGKQVLRRRPTNLHFQGHALIWTMKEKPPQYRLCQQQVGMTHLAIPNPHHHSTSRGRSKRSAHQVRTRNRHTAILRCLSKWSLTIHHHPCLILPAMTPRILWSPLRPQSSRKSSLHHHDSFHHGRALLRHHSSNRHLRNPSPWILHSSIPHFWALRL